jgi:hypothetical protein
MHAQRQQRQQQWQQQQQQHECTHYHCVWQSYAADAGHEQRMASEHTLRVAMISNECLQ